MALSVDSTTNMTIVDDCDAATNWNGTPSTYSGFQREGTNCLGKKVSQTTYEDYVTVTSVDLTSKRVYAWFKADGLVNTKANGGFRITIGDGTNRRAYYVGGSDDYGFQVGAWTCCVLDVSNLPANYAQTNGSSAPNITAITQIGIGCYMLSKALGNVDNFFWDIVRYGTGIIVTSTSGDDITFADIAADDASTAADKAYGIIREIQPGVYGVQGDILLGNTSGGSIDFKDQDAVVVFEDRVHGTGTNTAYQFKGQHSATGTFSLELGIAVGSGDDESGRGGVVFVNANPTSQPVTFDFSDSNIEDVFLYGCSLIGCRGTIKFSADGTNGISHHLSGVSFNNCSQVDLGVVVTRNCIFAAYNPDTDGALLWNGSINIKNCKFLGCTDATNDPHAIEHPSSGTFTYDNLTFSGNDYDINFSATSGTLTINAINGANPSTYEITSGGTSVTINNTVTLKVICNNEAGNAIEGVRVRIEDDPLGTQISQGSTNASGEYVDSTYNYSTDEDVKVVARLKGYKFNSAFSTITSDGLTVPFTMIRDPAVDLP